MQGCHHAVSRHFSGAWTFSYRIKLTYTVIVEHFVQVRDMPKQCFYKTEVLKTNVRFIILRSTIYFSVENNVVIHVKISYSLYKCG
jgi:hypothetical protein